MYAYAPDGVVADLRAQVPAYHPDLAALYRPVPAGLAGRVALGWVVDGAGYAPPPDPTLLPDASAVPDVSSAQAKIALIRAGHMPAVRAAVAQASEEVQVWFSDARTWQRANPYVVAIGAGLGLPDEAIDALFRQAATIAA